MSILFLEHVWYYMKTNEVYQCLCLANSNIVNFLKFFRKHLLPVASKFTEIDMKEACLVNIN